VETLEQDNSALKEKASKLQEKVKAAAKGEERYFLLSSISLEWLSSVLMFSFL